MRPLPAAERRARTLERLRTGTLDVLVVGAGIVGSRVALDAARAGLRVGLVDAGDFAGATSSASAKLVHGGLRYLSTGRVGLVRASRLEQHALCTQVAPHLTRRLPMVLALHADAGPTRRALRAGLWTYGALSGFRTPGGSIVAPRVAAELVPQLAVPRLTGCALFAEAQTHDARLTLATVAAADRAGAAVCNHVRVVAFEHARGRVAGAILAARGGDVLTVRARAVVNAAGPWADEVRRLAEGPRPPLARLSKGVHAVLPAPEGWKAGLAVSLPGGRAAYAVPWFGTLLVGVTDTPYDARPAAAHASDEDVTRVLEGLAGFLPAEMLARTRVLSAFAGLRVLPAGTGDTVNAARDHVLDRGATGLVSVAGGKLTTHRRIALAALATLPPEVRPRRLSLDATPLPGSSTAPARPPGDVDPRVWRHLVALYGDAAAELVELRETAADALDPIDPAGPDVWAQAYYAVEREWALTAEDIAWRRTTLAVRGLAPRALLARLSGRVELERL